MEVRSMEKSKEQKAPRDLIVSSAHLALGSSPALSELEYGSVLFSHAFNRWMVAAWRPPGGPSLSPVEILVIHSVRHRGRPKTLSDLCLLISKRLMTPTTR